MRGCVDIYITTSTRAHLQLAPIGYYIEPKLRECERERGRVRERVSVSLLLVIDSVSMCVAVTLYDLYPCPR